MRPSEYGKIAIIIPCYNEEQTIAAVIDSCRQFLPIAEIYVCDNNSTDQTSEISRTCGANLLFVHNQGKGNVIRRAFADVEADVFVMVDGDSTYCLSALPDMVQLLLERKYDIVNGSRESKSSSAFRGGHVLGNKLLSKIVSLLFHSEAGDMLSGFKVFSRRFVKSFPATSTGFQIETEIAIHALRLRIPMIEVPVDYYERPVGSISKLSTYKDGFSIILTIFRLLEVERPLLFWSFVSSFLGIVSLVLAYPIVITYLETGFVPRFPTAFLCGFLAVISVFSFFSGITLDLLQKTRDDIKHLHYLSIPFKGVGTAWIENDKICQKHGNEYEPSR